MTNSLSAIDLTKKLLAFNTVNPPGNERESARFVGGVLQSAGFTVDYYEFDEMRTSVVATKYFSPGKAPICFTGHLDTVPLGLGKWEADPFGGMLEGDKIFGRGASDMKGGVAAMITAAVRLADVRGGKGGISLVLTAGEEIRCRGAEYLASLDAALHQAGALVVGEPTSNYPVLGHKGIFWLEADSTGVTAHGSMPEQGDNAIYKMARAITRLETFNFKASTHPVLGKPTLNVGTITGGININSVPDRATIGIDIRTVPEQDFDRLQRDLQTYLGEEVRLNFMQASPAVFTDPENDWVQEVFRIMVAYIGEDPQPRGIPYYTDAAALSAALGHPPTIIMGPGEPEMAHKTDEYCHVSKIEAAAEAYFEITRKWCGL
jgi:succinyl-diaminopimelate desuccinylase